MRCQSFPPLYRADARVLILGTMPSVASLEAGQYYAHPRNAFWRIQCELWDAPYVEDYAARARLLLTHRVALWDTIAQCEREGSLDAAMRERQPNDIAGLTRELPALRQVFCNGQTAYKEYLRHFAALTVPVMALPSTSPAYTLAYEKKLAAWRVVREAAEQ